jgi:hypothetical protein
VVITPRRLVVESSPKDGAAYLVRVYVFYIGEGELLDWQPDSWEDADAGIVRNVHTGEERSFGFMVEQSDDNYVHAVITSSPALLVAVNAYDRMYAWRTVEYKIPMERVQIPVRFLIYKKPAGTYKDTEWTVAFAPEAL